VKSENMGCGPASCKKFVSNTSIIIWAVVIGGIFAYLWWQGQLKRLTVYVQETREELKKCSWPSWEELKGSTAVIVFSIALLGGFTVAMDHILAFIFYKLYHMRSQWFVIHTLSGQEQKVKESIEKRVKTDEMQDFVKEVLVPMEKVVEVRNQKKTVTSRKLWPGYVFVDMVLLDENNRIIEEPWYFIKETQGVIGFVGGEPPVPTPTEEVEQIKNQISQSEETEKPKVNFEVGETIKINNGPFLNFSGVIEEIDPERGKLKVTVNIFGRNTPVELEYWQVEKA
jgi:transcriptional antiterminator NusG